MKKPETMIKEYEATHTIYNNGMRLYTYVRPRSNGEATIEVWGARNHVGRKGKPLCVKHFFTFRTEDDAYRTKDTLRYTSYSRMVQDHICYHATEIGGGNYKSWLGDMLGKWGWRKLSDTRECFLPTGTMLNGWEGTKYKWCAYNTNCGLSAISYVRLYAKYNQAETLSKAKQFQLLKEPFLKHLSEEKEFAKYVAQNHAVISLHHMTVSNIETAFKRKKTCQQYMDTLLRQHERNERLRADRLAAQRIENERRHAEYLRKQRIEAKQYDKAISALYKRIKSICGIYGCYEVIVPKTSGEMFDEGEAMHNCVGAIYSAHHAHGDDIIVFLRKDGKPCVDMRIDPETMKIEECRFTCNKDAMNDAEVMTEANKVLEKFKKVWKEVA